MAHEVETMAYAGAAPWHIGETQDRSRALTEDERRDWRMVAKRAGLDWDVELVQVQTVDGTACPESRAVRRIGNGSILGMVGTDFRPLQNSDMLAWFQPFIDQGLGRFETAGTLRDGKRVWAMIALEGQSYEVVPGDKLAPYLMLSHGHDGQHKLQVGTTFIRIVCANTNRAARADGRSQLLTLLHTSGLEMRLEQAREIFDTARRSFSVTLEQYQFLAARGFDADELRRYIRTVLEVPQTAEEKDISTRKRNQMEAIERRVLTQPGPREIRGTWWAAYNGVTDYFTHDHNPNGAEGNRMASLWWGANAERDKNALGAATELAKARG